jgi:hypothetical protein
VDRLIPFQGVKAARFPRIAETDQDMSHFETTTLENQQLVRATRKMIMRVQRFFKVCRLLPRVGRRTFTEETPKTALNGRIIPSAGAASSECQETLHVAHMREQLELSKKAIESLKSAALKPASEIQNHTSEEHGPTSRDQVANLEAPRSVSEVHWASADGYETGGHLRHGQRSLNRHDEKGLPTWGDWGVCVKITGWGRTSAFTM